MESFKRLSQDRDLVFADSKTKPAEKNCQSTALTTAVFHISKLTFGNQNQ